MIIVDARYDPSIDQIYVPFSGESLDILHRFQAPRKCTGDYLDWYVVSHHFKNRLIFPASCGNGHSIQWFNPHDSTNSIVHADYEFLYWELTIAQDKNAKDLMALFMTVMNSWFSS